MTGSSRLSDVTETTFALTSRTSTALITTATSALDRATILLAGKKSRRTRRVSGGGLVIRQASSVNWYNAGN